MKVGDALPSSFRTDVSTLRKSSGRGQSHSHGRVHALEVQLAAADDIGKAVPVIETSVGESDEITPSPAEAIVRFQTTLADEELGRMLARLVEAQVPVTQFREVAGDLEDAFLTATQAPTTDASESDGNGEIGQPTEATDAE